LKKKVFWSLAGFLLVCLPVLALVRGNMIPPASAAQQSTAMIKTVSDSDAAARSYWTPERQKSAISADTLIPKQKISPASLTQSRNVSSPPSKGKAQSKPPTPPSKPMAANQKQALDQGNGTPVLPPSSATGTAVSKPPIVLSQSNTTSQKQALDGSPVPYPYPSPESAVGKVLFHDPVDGSDYACSGTVVTSNNRSTINTAGHCVAGGGQQYYYTRWVFCPQWTQDKGCQAGLWTARLLVVDPKWYDHGWDDYDYGEAVMNPNDKGNVVDAVGGVGWTYNQPYEQKYATFGFPGADPLSNCTAFYSQSVPVPGSPGPGDIAIPNCNLGGGSSGGAWLISLDGHFGFLDGNCSIIVSWDDQVVAASPYYGDNWFALFNRVQNM
jgi:hypothetical protein